MYNSDSEEDTIEEDFIGKLVFLEEHNAGFDGLKGYKKANVGKGENYGNDAGGDNESLEFSLDSLNVRDDSGTGTKAVANLQKSDNYVADVEFTDIFKIDSKVGPATSADVQEIWNFNSKIKKEPESKRLSDIEAKSEQKHELSDSPKDIFDMTNFSKYSFIYSPEDDFQKGSKRSLDNLEEKGNLKTSRENIFKDAQDQQSNEKTVMSLKASSSSSSVNVSKQSDDIKLEFHLEEAADVKNKNIIFDDYIAQMESHDEHFNNNNQKIYVKDIDKEESFYGDLENPNNNLTDDLILTAKSLQSHEVKKNKTNHTKRFIAISQDLEVVEQFQIGSKENSPLCLPNNSKPTFPIPVNSLDSEYDGTNIPLETLEKRENETEILNYESEEVKEIKQGLKGRSLKFSSRSLERQEFYCNKGWL